MSVFIYSLLHNLLVTKKTQETQMVQKEENKIIRSALVVEDDLICQRIIIVNLTK